MTKADVLSTFKEIKVCESYTINGEHYDYFPYSIEGEIETNYTTLEGWDEDLTGLSDIAQLPAQLEKYIEYLEAKLEVPISVVSVGPDRTQTLIRSTVNA